MGQVLTKSCFTYYIGSAASLIVLKLKLVCLFKVLRYSLLQVFYRYCKITMKLEKSERLSFHGTNLKKCKIEGLALAPGNLEESQVYFR